MSRRSSDREGALFRGAPGDGGSGGRPGVGERGVLAEVDAEIRFHLETRATELEAAGWSRDDAWREALRRFGDVDLTRRVCMAADVRTERKMRRRDWFLGLARDTRHAVRALVKRPGFALLAIVTLAVGIGANTAIFSAADHILLRALPYAESDRVVTLWQTDESTGNQKGEVAAGNFVEWQRRAESFEALGLAEPFGFDLTGDGRPIPVGAWLVTQEYAAALGIDLVLGRWFSADEYVPNTSPSVIVSHALWRDRFGGDAAIVGTTIELDFAPATVVGVLPPGLDFPGTEEIWAPKWFRDGEDQDRRSAYMQAVGRLKPGVSLEASQRDADRVAAQMAVDFPQTNAGTGLNLVPIEAHILGPVRTALLVLLGAVGLVLLIACANVAGLLLARGAERSREFGVRAALGASRSRLIRQLLAETSVLGVMGGVLGVGLAFAGVRVFQILSPPELPRVDGMGVDARVLAFAAFVTFVTVALFGLLPALRFSRPNLQPVLTSGTRTIGDRRAVLRSVLVIGEIALALVLLAGAGLLGRSFVMLLRNDPGFETTNRATVQLFLWDRNPTGADREQRVAEMDAQFESTPGVERAALVSALPFHPTQIDVESSFTVDDRPPPPPGQEPVAQTTIASPDYFDVMGIALLRGRAFTDRDRFDAPRVALINETLARRVFGAEEVIGRTVTFGAMDRPVSREIVGIVADVRPTTLDSDPRAELYVPYAQSGTGSVTFVIQTARNAAAMLPALREAVWQVDADQSVYHSATLEAMISDTLVTRRFHLFLLGAISLVALILATVGIYGLIAVMTRERSGEIGIRMALGARRGEVVTMIVRDALALALPGVAIGIGGALLMTRSLRTMLFGIEPTDPLTLVAITTLTVAAAAGAALLPARRAARTDPMRVLRQE